MAAPAPHRPRFALDTNVLIDLASYRRTGLATPPTVIQELVFIATSQHPRHLAQPFAAEALANMRRWNITPYDLIAVGHGITEINARKLMDISLICRGQRAVSAEMALKLGRLFSVSPELWLGIQTDFDLEIARLRCEKRIDRDVHPLAELQLAAA